MTTGAPLGTVGTLMYARLCWGALDHDFPGGRSATDTTVLFTKRVGVVSGAAGTCQPGSGSRQNIHAVAPANEAQGAPAAYQHLGGMQVLFTKRVGVVSGAAWTCRSGSGPRQNVHAAATRAAGQGPTHAPSHPPQCSQINPRLMGPKMVT